MNKRSFADADYGDSEDDLTPADRKANWLLNVIWNCLRVVVSLAIAIVVIAALVSFIVDLVTRHA